MKKWKEYNENIKEYYEWIMDDGSVLNNMVVASYNISGINYDKAEFWKYCKTELLDDLLISDSIYVYMVATEKVENNNSKLERYKKCWKKISDLVDVHELELGLEIEHEYNGNYYYSGIAKTRLRNLEKVLKILDCKGHKYIVFMSKKDYFNDNEDISKLILDYVLFDEYGDINYTNSFSVCKKNQDIVCRYGVDSISAELALILSKDNMNTYFSNRFVEHGMSTETLPL